MPEFCSAYGCSNERCLETRSRGITFHKFPKESILRRQWELAVKRKGFVATEWSVLCSEHFNPDDFDRTGQIVRLRQGVKPSVFNFPSYLQKQVPSRKTKPSKKAEESLPVDLPQHFCKAETYSNVDHNYALPASPTLLKARLNEALARVACLEHEKRNSMDRERRAKKNVRALLEDLTVANKGKHAATDETTHLVKSAAYSETLHSQKQMQTPKANAKTQTPCKTNKCAAKRQNNCINIKRAASTETKLK